MAQARPAESYYGANVIAVLFILINSLLSWFADWLERWLRNRKKGSTTVVDSQMMEEQAPDIHLQDGGKP